MNDMEMGNALKIRVRLQRSSAIEIIKITDVSTRNRLRYNVHLITSVMEIQVFCRWANTSPTFK
jgi:hypothetical protein